MVSLCMGPDASIVLFPNFLLLFYLLFSDNSPDDKFQVNCRTITEMVTASQSRPPFWAMSKDMGAMTPSPWLLFGPSKLNIKA